MAIIAMCGMESTDPTFEAFQQVTTQSGWAPIGTASQNTSIVRTGTRSVRCNPASGANGYAGFGGTSAAFYHFGMYVATLPSIDRGIFGTASPDRINVRLTSAGALGIYLENTLIGTSSAAFATPGWHWLGIRAVTGSSVPFLQIDGVTEVTGSATVAAWNSNIGPGGTEATSVDLYVDDYIVDDAGFIAPSKVGLLRPISDNARGANWFKADGSTTTNLFQCVDNPTPLGVASANEAANPDVSIRHTGGANNSYDANMTTYATAGMNQGDTLLASLSWIRHGEDINTGTKNLAYGLVSNPNLGIGSSFTAGTDAGAHAAETGQWKTHSTMTQSPGAVTVSSSPVMRVNRPETASRVACVSQMGTVVAWTPAAPTIQPFRSIYRQQLGQ